MIDNSNVLIFMDFYGFFICPILRPFCNFIFKPNPYCFFFFFLKTLV